MCGGFFGGAFDAFSDFIGTGGGDQGLANLLDEGVQSVGSGLAEVDDFVNEEIPGGYATLAAIAVPFAAPYITGAALTAGEVAALAAATKATTSAIQGDDLETILIKAALAGATSYGGSSLGGLGGSESAFTGATETGLATLASEAAVADAIGATLLTPEFLAPEFIAPEFGPSYADLGYNPAMPMGPTYTEMGYNPPMGPSYADLGIEQFGPSYGDLGIDSAKIYDYSPETAIQSVSPELDPTGSLASSGVKVTDLLRAANAAKGLLGGNQQPATAGAPTSDSRLPQGLVDYSGILNLLQTRSPSRTSLL